MRVYLQDNIVCKIVQVLSKADILLIVKRETPSLDLSSDWKVIKWKVWKWGIYNIYSVAIMVLYTECSKLKHILVCFTKGRYVTSVASVSHWQEHFRSRDLYKHNELTKSNTSYVSHNCVHIFRDLLTENVRKLTCLRWMLACNEGEHI